MFKIFCSYRPLRRRRTQAFACNVYAIIRPNYIDFYVCLFFINKWASETNRMTLHRPRTDYLEPYTQALATVQPTVPLDSADCQRTHKHTSLWHFSWIKQACNYCRQRFRPLCRYVANWTSCLILNHWALVLLCENVTSSTKPEVHNAFHFHQSRTEPRPQ